MPGLTKKHETAFLTTLSGALEHYREEPPRGECVIVMEGREQTGDEQEKQKLGEHESGRTYENV